MKKRLLNRFEELKKNMKKPKILEKIEERKYYSELDDIVICKASDIITEGVLLLQGGAFRGVYTSGVTDFLMLNDINFRNVVGVSAGALNGITYVSGDIGRAALMNLGHRHDPSWIGLKALLDKDNNGIIGFSYAFGDFNKEYPIDEARLFDGKRNFIATATCLEDGKNHYFKNDSKILYHGVMASASMPYISKPVLIEGKSYLDGGCYDSLPINYVLDNFKNEKIVVVLTRHRGYRDQELNNTVIRLNHTMYKKYPKFIKSLDNMNKVLNEDFDKIDKLEKEGKIFVIAPSKPINISRLEGNMEKLGEVYKMGYNDAKECYNDLLKFLEK